MDRETEEDVVHVRTRLPVFEAVVDTRRSVEFVRERLDADFDGEERFVVRSRRGGVERRLRPVITGRLVRNPSGHCAIVFRVAFPPAWWLLDLALLAVLSVYTVRSAPDRPLLLLCLAILLFVTFFALPLKGSAFARKLCITMKERT